MRFRMRSSNPAMSQKFWQTAEATGTNVMTVTGTAVKTGFLVLTAVAAASLTWPMVSTAVAAGNMAPVLPWIIGGVIGGFIFMLVTMFKPTWAPVTAPAYAAFEGLFLGAISASLSIQYGGIAFQALGLTFGVVIVMALLYASGMVRATAKLRTALYSACGAIFLIYIVSFIMYLMGSGGLPYIHEGGPIGIGFSLIIVGVASFFLILDFDFIEKGAQAGAPKYMEWYGAFGLMVTLVWLYVEILILLAKLRGRD